MSTESDLVPGLLPERAVLVHIGPYKTGTTAIQSSLHEHRAELTEAASARPTYREPSGTRWSPRYAAPRAAW
jgi:hypothetical protein